MLRLAQLSLSALVLVGSPSLVCAQGWKFADLRTGQVDSTLYVNWQQLAPGGAGSNRGIFADSVDPLKVWMAPDMGNDYLTTDGGSQWDTIIPADVIWSQRTELSAEAIVSDPKSPDVVVSLVGKDITLSIDGGRSFERITSYASGNEPDSDWYAAVAHPTESGTWFVANGNDFKDLRSGVDLNPVRGIDATQPKVWKVTDITAPTRTIPAMPDAGMDRWTSVFDIVCHPNTAQYPEMLFAGTSTGVYRKTSGTNWVRIFDGCCKLDANWDGSTLTLYVLQHASYTVVPGPPPTIDSSGGVFKTTIPEVATLALGWIDQSSGLRVDLSALAGIRAWQYQNTVKGWFGYANGEEQSFVRPSSYLPNFAEIRCDPTNPDRVFLSNWRNDRQVSVVTGAVWATLDGGNSWFAASRLGPGFDTDAYWSQRQLGRAHRNVPLQIYDRKFAFGSYSYDFRGCRSMTIAADGTVYASIEKGYQTVKYDADGDAWTSVDNTRVGDAYFSHGNGDVGTYGVMPDVHRPGEMFLLQNEFAIWKTTDDTHPRFPGAIAARPLPALVDWLPLYTPTAFAQHPTDSNAFYFLSERMGIFAKSSDNGASFVVHGEPIPVADHTTNPVRIYWRSLRVAPDGVTMYAVAEVIGPENWPMGWIAHYNVHARKGVYKSVDEGVTWTCVNGVGSSSLPVCAAGYDPVARTPVGSDSACVKALVMAVENQDVLYAGVMRYRPPPGTGNAWVRGGLFRTGNGGGDWQRISIPTGIRSVWDVWIHSGSGGAESSIYIACGADGTAGASGTGGVWRADYRVDGAYRASDWRLVFDHPFCTHVRTSALDGDRLLVATRETSSIGDRNAGLFVSLTAGEAGDGSDWLKVNGNRSSMPTSEICFDGADPNRIWASGAASGCFTATLPTVAPTEFGQGTSGTGGVVPRLSARGFAIPSGPVSVDVVQGRGAASGVLLLGLGPTSRISVPILGGTVSVLPAVSAPLTLEGAAGVPGSGSGSLGFVLPAGASWIGTELNAQAVFVDPGGPFGVSMTPGLGLRIDS